MSELSKQQIEFKEYWATRPSCDYDEMVEAEAAFSYQASRMPKAWRDASESLPEPQTQVLAIRLASDEQMSIDKEYCPIIFAALDDERSVWYDWESDKDIDTRYFEITHWMPITDLV